MLDFSFAKIQLASWVLALPAPGLLRSVRWNYAHPVTERLSTSSAAIGRSSGNRRRILRRNCKNPTLSSPSISEASPSRLTSGIGTIPFHVPEEEVRQQARGRTVLSTYHPHPRKVDTPYSVAGVQEVVVLAPIIAIRYLSSGSFVSGFRR